MVARLWRATATEGGAALYQQHFAERVLPSLQRLRGYAGALLLQRPVGNEVQLLVISWWASAEAIRDFAGPDINRAVVDEEARRVLERCDETVEHMTVRASDRLEFGG
jgi:heme-degrading monooxygenase HmoA